MSDIPPRPAFTTPDSLHAVTERLNHMITLLEHILFHVANPPRTVVHMPSDLTVDYTAAAYGQQWKDE